VEKLKPKYIKSIVKQTLREDLNPSGDITTKAIKNKKVIAKIVANQKCVVGGLGFAKEAFRISDKKISFKEKIKDGKKVNKGKTIAIIKGSSLGILKSERVALNFLSLISGVATTTNEFVKKIRKKTCKVLCTRKTFPNLRMLQKYGVRLGGGQNHRFNLSDEVLIKDNHISTNNNIRDLVKRVIKKNKGKKITVEVDNLTQLKEIIGLKFNRILFDNMSIKNLRKALKIVNKKYQTEASGGVTLKNIGKISLTGVSKISVGQITHSPKNIDFSLTL